MPIHFTHLSDSLADDPPVHRNKTNLTRIKDRNVLKFGLLQTPQNAFDAKLMTSAGRYANLAERLI